MANSPKVLDFSRPAGLNVYKEVVLSKKRITRLVLAWAIATSSMFANGLSQVQTVFIILMENHNWSSIIGNPSAPYINGQLLPIASHAEQYYDPPGLHPSLPNYLWLEAGSNFGITDDGDPSSHQLTTAEHLVTQLTLAGKTWKAYEEDIPGTACPLSDVNDYAVRHDPFVYFTDLTNNNNSNSPTCIAHVRPYTQLATDLQNNQVANYNFITPNLCDDMHDCDVSAGDSWLSTQIPKIMNSTAYQNGGAIFITWDEGENNSDGPIGMIVVSPFAKSGYSNSVHYTHSSTLLTMEEIFGLSVKLGDSANATDLSDLFANTKALAFIPTAPCRIADTRNPAGPFGAPEMSAGASRDFAIPNSSCGIPGNAAAYSLNVTVIPDSKLNYLTIWPSGQAQPFVSTLNSDGRVKANAAIVTAGASGAVRVFATDATQLILDIDGYFVPAGTASALAFYPLAPCRVADTRFGGPPLGGPSLIGGETRPFPVLSSGCSVPPAAQAYSMNITAVPQATLGYLTTWSTGQSQPLVSTLNAPTGVVTANAAIVPAGTNGSISMYVTDPSDIIIDIDGYFGPPSNGLSLYPVNPCRALDTRSSSGQLNGVLAINVVQSVCNIPSTAQAFVFNATVVPAGPLLYLTLWPNGQPQPFVSTLNAFDGAITSNMALVPTRNGSIDAFGSNSTQLVLDISGYFAP